MREALLALVFVLVGASGLDFKQVDPYTEVLYWSDGLKEEVPTINKALCDYDIDRLTNKVYSPIGRESATLLKGECIHRNSFKPGWDRI